MPKFRKKPVVIEAIQYNGDNEFQIMEFVGKQLVCSKPPRQMINEQDVPREAIYMIIPTLEGEMKACKLDFIIKGVNGEFYPCKPHIFQKIYDPIDC